MMSVAVGSPWSRFIVHEPRDVALVFDSASLDADQQIRNVQCSPLHTLMSKFAADGSIWLWRGLQ